MVIRKLLKNSLIFGGIITMCLLLITNFFYTSYTYSSWYPLIFSNSIVSSLLKIFLATLLLYVLYLTTQILNKKQLVITIIIVNVLSLLIRLYLIESFKNGPVADAWFIFDGTDVLHFTDNPHYLTKGMYFGTNPQQLGMTTLLLPITTLFRFDVNGHFRVFALMIQMTIIFATYALYKIKGVNEAFFVSVLLSLFVPNYFATFLIYGDVFSLFYLIIAFTFFVIWKYNFEEKYTYIFFPLISLFIGLAYLARVNILVYIIAIIILVLLTSKNLRVVSSIIMLSFLVIGFTYPLNNLIYATEKIEIGEYSHPFNTYLRLGMGYSGMDGVTPGFHNYQVDVDLAELNYNKIEMEKYNQEIIQKQIDELIDSNQLIAFFYEKVKVSWTDPDFEMMTLILPYSGMKFENPKEESKVNLYGSGAFDLVPLNDFGNWITNSYYEIRKYEKVFYFSILIGALVLFLRKHESNFTLFGMLITIGFVLLNLIIEIKSRYVYVYLNTLIIILSMFVPELIENVVQYLQKIMKKLRSLI